MAEPRQKEIIQLIKEFYPDAEKEGIKFIENQLLPELLGFQSLNTQSAHNSSSRAYMFGSHFTQRLVISGADVPRLSTGIDRELGKYTFKKKMPADGTIIKKIVRYPRGSFQDSLNFSPEIIVLFHNKETGCVDYLSIPYHSSYHQYFGYRNKMNVNNMSMLTAGAEIPKDTVFADSPSINDNGDYMYGINAKVAYMSLPGVAEDGFIVSDEFIEKLKFTVYDTRTVSFGSKMFPRNLYGDQNRVQIFPEIGDYIHESGILMALFENDHDLAPALISREDVCKVDYIFDKLTYVRGPGGRVVDIRVICNNAASKNLPSTMMEQVNKYSKALLIFYREIIKAYEELKLDCLRKTGSDKVNLSKALRRLIVEAFVMTNKPVKDVRHAINYLHRKEPVDEVRIEFTIETVIKPDIGFKLAAQHGDKGVICKIEKKKNMPRAVDGTYADIVKDGGSTIDRMNTGRLYEHYLNSVLESIEDKIKTDFDLAIKSTKRVTLDYVLSKGASRVEQAHDYLVNFYKLIAAKQYIFFNSLTELKDKAKHIQEVINYGARLYLPTDNPIERTNAIKMIDERYPSVYDRVTYVGNSGIRKTTRRRVRIADVYVMLLEKIADTGSSTSTAKTHYLGPPAPISRDDKFALPWRNGPVRTIGETEGRVYSGYGGRECIAEMIDRSNNPESLKAIVNTLLRAEKPGDIVEPIVDRHEIPLGNTKPLQLINSIFACAGTEMIYVPDKDIEDLYKDKVLPLKDD